jgi:hypothetical protein
MYGSRLVGGGGVEPRHLTSSSWWGGGIGGMELKRKESGIEKRKS